MLLIMLGGTIEKKVTAVHKANIQKLTDGLFLQSIRNISNNYPEVEYEEKNS